MCHRKRKPANRAKFWTFILMDKNWASDVAGVSYATSTVARPNEMAIIARSKSLAVLSSMRRRRAVMEENCLDDDGEAGRLNELLATYRQILEACAENPLGCEYIAAIHDDGNIHQLANPAQIEIAEFVPLGQH